MPLSFQPEQLHTAMKVPIGDESAKQLHNQTKDWTYDPAGGGSNTCTFDALDVTRQVLSNLAMVVYLQFVKASIQPPTKAKAEEMKQLRDKFLEILGDLDAALGTTPFFMLGPWVEGAKSFSKLVPMSADSAHDEQAEAALYEYNARNLVTMWGPDGQISDYSARLWSGLISDYYIPRWKLALDSAIEQVERGVSRPNDGPFSGKLHAFEQAWQRMHKTFPTKGSGSAAEKIGAVYDKYKALAEENCAYKTG
jgi:alpha-N-acetylglucosaminidase